MTGCLPTLMASNQPAAMAIIRRARQQSVLQANLTPGPSPGTVTLVLCRDMLVSDKAVRINDSTFDVPVSSPQGSTTIHGSFSSETVASGSVAGFVPVAPCPESTLVGDLIAVEPETWRAGKQ
jgi:hypothetical protein